MLDPIWVKAVLKVIVLPPCGPLLVSLTGLAIIRRRPRMGRVIARSNGGESDHQDTHRESDDGRQPRPSTTQELQRGQERPER